ncbi:hypothetical protein FKP32DRAFT_200938 [Trametes sanguinea]|nr:hypothetical protein FKP32DRAFT_200938 [Trametes sanguinea]
MAALSWTTGRYHRYIRGVAWRGGRSSINEMTRDSISNADLPLRCSSRSGMRSSVLPMELCEAIIDAVASTVPLPQPIWKFSSDQEWPRMYAPQLYQQSALYACTLICHAWSRRAQQLLWRRPLLCSVWSVQRFTELIQADAANVLAPLVYELRLNAGFIYDFSLPTMFPANVFMRSLSNLRTIYAHGVAWEIHDIHPRLIRFQLPLLAALKRLELQICSIGTLRMLFDVVWSCQELTHLTISQHSYNNDLNIHLPRGTLERWHLAQKSRNTCRKLTHLAVYETPFCPDRDVIIGALFGSAVTTIDTDLNLRVHPELFWNPIPLLHRSFPELRKIYSRTPWRGGTVRLSDVSTLELLLRSLAHPQVVEEIVLINYAIYRGDKSVYDVISAQDWLSRILPAEEQPDQPLRSILPSLRELRVVFSDIPVDTDYFSEGARSILTSISGLITVRAADHECISYDT